MEEHVKLLKSVFDFPAIQALLARPDFSFVYDSMHGVQGPYAKVRPSRPSRSGCLSLVDLLTCITLHTCMR